MRGTGRLVGAAIAGTTLAGAGIAAAATPSWHAPAYPSQPSGGVTPSAGFALDIAATTSGKASLLYQAKGGALYSVSRSSSQGAWGTAQPWLSGATFASDSSLSAVLGGKLSALWVNTSAVLRFGWGTQAASQGQASVPPAGGFSIQGVGLRPAGPSNLAYGYTAVNVESPAPSVVFAGQTPVGKAPPGQTVLGQAPTFNSPTLQTGTDNEGNQTAVWRETTDGTLQVATRAAGTANWVRQPPIVPSPSPPPLLSRFALAVNGDGRAVVAYVTDYQSGTVGGQSYVGGASLAIVQRGGPFLPFGPPQVVETYTATPPTAQTVSFYQFGYPLAITAAAGGGRAVVGWIVQPGGEFSPPTLRVTRTSSIGSAFPAPTSVTDPQANTSAEEAGWTPSGIDAAVDPQGNAGVVFAGSSTQGNMDGVWATTSTAAAPRWTAAKDIARCKDSSGGAAGPSIAASPSGGLVAAWGCLSSTPASSTSSRQVGLAAFDTAGPPIISFTMSGAKATFKLGESGNYTLTAKKGSTTVSGSGSASASATVTRTLKLSAGSWQVTLKAIRAGGLSTSLTKSTTVSG